MVFHSFLMAFRLDPHLREHIELPQEARVVARHVVRPRAALDLVLRADGLRPKAQVRHRAGARLLGAVVEVALDKNKLWS